MHNVPLDMVFAFYVHFRDQYNSLFLENKFKIKIKNLETKNDQELNPPTVHKADKFLVKVHLSNFLYLVV